MTNLGLASIVNNSNPLLLHFVQLWMIYIIDIWTNYG